MKSRETMRIENQKFLKLIQSEFASLATRGCSVSVHATHIVIEGPSERALKPLVRSLTQAQQIYDKISKL